MKPMKKPLSSKEKVLLLGNAVYCFLYLISFLITGNILWTHLIIQLIVFNLTIWLIFYLKE